MTYVLLNFIIDYIILRTCCYILKLHTTRFRLIISSLIGELLIISFFIEFSNIILLFFKLLIGLLMVYISFDFNDIKSFIKNTIYFYIVNFFLGGILYYFKSSGLIKYNFVIFFIPIIMNIYKYFEYDIKNILSYKYRVTIYLNNGKIIHLNGFMDTANTLIEPYSNRKVIITNKKIIGDYYLVPCSTINNESLIKCFNPKKVYIEGIGERNDISIGIVNKKFVGYNCLLNYKLLEGIC